MNEISARTSGHRSSKNKQSMKLESSAPPTVPSKIEIKPIGLRNRRQQGKNTKEELEVEDREDEMKQRVSRMEAEALRKAQQTEYENEEAEEEEEEEEEEDEEDVEIESEEAVETGPIVKQEEMATDEEQLVEQDDDETVAITANNKRRDRAGFSFMRLTFYAILLAVLVFMLLFVVVPNVLPSCCDYRKDYLLFNEQKYDNDDGMLPF